MNDAEQEFEDYHSGFGKACFVHRFTDSAEVRGMSANKAGFTKPQPADYLVTLYGVTFYAEVKGTEHKTAFQFNKIRPSQWAAAKQQAAAGGLYFFFIKNLNTGQWYRVPGEVFLAHSARSVKWSELQPFRCEFVH